MNFGRFLPLGRTFSTGIRDLSLFILNGLHLKLMSYKGKTSAELQPRFFNNNLDILIYIERSLKAVLLS